MKFIKELFFYIVLIAAIVLVASIAFYRYIPDTVTIPSKVSYTPLDTSKFELSDADSKEDVILTHNVNQDILNQYEAKNQYEVGKVNPFGNATTTVTNTTTNSNKTNTNTTNNTGTSNNSTTNNNSNILNIFKAVQYRIIYSALHFIIYYLRKQMKPLSASLLP